MRINTNLIAMNTFNQYTKNNNNIASSVEKLSSGYAINSAADNAAGLAISEKMRAQIRGLDQASSNAQDAISLTQTAEGALSSSTEILQRMREISVQSSNDTNENDIDRSALQDEFSQLQSELNDISSTTTFNKKNLLDGSLASSTTSVAINNLANSGMKVSTGNVSAGNYSFSVGLKQESAKIDQVTGTTSASLGTTAKATFSGATPINPSTAGALYNGNYTLSTKVNDDKTLTVTAKGDNGQTFTATVSQAALTTASTTPNSSIALNFASSDGTSDGFGVSLTVDGTISTSDNGLASLASAINDVTTSVDGGVDAQAATYGVYASMTGGESVKLNAGDTSVTFGNGVTVSFDKLSATDTTVSSYTSTGYSYVVNNAAGSKDISGIFGNSAGALTLDITGGTIANGTANLSSITLQDASTDGTDTTITVSDGTNTYTWTGANSTFELATSGSAALSFSDGNGNTLTGSVVSVGDNSAVTLTSGTGITSDGTALTSVTSTASTVSTPTLSSGLLGKLGSADNITDSASGAITKTDATTFAVSKSANAGLTFQVGANSGDEMTINIDKMDAQTLGISSAKVDTQEAASAAIKTVDAAINTVSSQRAYLGAVENRLNYKINNLDTTNENLTSAESQIRDVDMASEMTKFTNANILSQAATAMLAQANSLPQNVLSLLK